MRDYVETSLRVIVVPGQTKAHVELLAYFLALEGSHGVLRSAIGMCAVLTLPSGACWKIRQHLCDRTCLGLPYKLFPSCSLLVVRIGLGCHAPPFPAKRWCRQDTDTVAPL